MEGSENVLDLRVAHWRRDDVTREILEALEKMSDDEKLVFLEYVGYVTWEGKEHKSHIKQMAADIRERRKRGQG